MSLFFLFYSEANIVCFIIFGILFLHDLLGIDRQEKVLKYDRTLLAFMLYFVSDSVWAAVLSGLIPKNTFTVLIPNMTNAILMAVITYCWFRYALAVLNVKGRNTDRFRYLTASPLILSVTIILVSFVINPGLFLNEDMTLKPIYSVFQVGLPILYILAELVYTIRVAVKTKSSEDRSRFISVGVFPLLVVVGGVIQVLSSSNTPIFCFSSTILMILFYIQSMENQISLDPLTGLNNRAQLFRYVSQDNTIRRDGRLTFVVMIDINYFKEINDTYGHSYGDKALVAIAEAMRKAAGRGGMPVFLGRYGGDEFIIIAHPTEGSQMETLTEIIHEEIHNSCKEAGLPFDMTVGIGYEQLYVEGEDSFQRALETADAKLYENKRSFKEQQAQRA